MHYAELLQFSLKENLVNDGSLTSAFIFHNSGHSEFIYHSAISNLNVSDYLSNPQNYQCKESKLSYEPHGRVTTGDLRVIENAKLKELVAKGPNTKEPNRVKWKATETPFLESTDHYGKHWFKREQADLKYLSEWNNHLKGYFKVT